MIDPQNKKEVDLEDLDKQIRGYIAFLGESKKYEDYKKSLEGKNEEEQEELAQEMLASLAKQTKTVVQGMASSRRNTKKESSQAEARRAEFVAEQQRKAEEQEQKRIQREQRAKEAHERINKEREEKEKLNEQNRAELARKLDRENAKNWKIQDENKEGIFQMTEAWRKRNIEVMMESRIDSDRNLARNRMRRVIQRQHELGEECTKRVQSLAQLTNRQLDNKKKKDPQGNFQRFSGTPYRWAVELKQFTTKEDLQEMRLLDEKNDRHERVVATHLGNFAYDKFLSGPTAEDPKGKYGFGETRGPAIIGVTKFDNDGKCLGIDIVLARLEDVNESNKHFFKDTVLSEEWIEQAKERNCSFLGSIAQKNGEYYIACNWIWDMHLVEALKWAEYDLGVVYQANGESRKMQFRDLREELRNMQVACVEGFKNPIVKKDSEHLEVSNKKAAGGNLWER